MELDIGGEELDLAGHATADALGVAGQPTHALREEVAARTQPRLLLEYVRASDDQKGGQQQTTDQELHEHRDA